MTIRCLRSLIFGFGLVSLCASFVSVTQAWAELPSASASCSEVTIPGDFSDDGQISWTSYDIDVLVVTDPAGKYGYKATIKNQARTYDELDVMMSSLSATEAREQFSELGLIDFATEKVDPDKIFGASAANIGVEANLEDGAGLVVLDFRGEDGKTLAKFITLGWLIGRCGK